VRLRPSMEQRLFHRQGVAINVTVSHGDLNSVLLTVIDSAGSSNTAFDMTADEYIDFTVELSDLDTNPIDPSILVWYLTNLDSGEFEIITDSLMDTNMRWDASLVGNWSISASAVNDAGYNVSDAVTMIVHHGEAVLVFAELDTAAQTAGGEITMTVTGQDADENIFAQLVEWSENGTRVENISHQGDGTYIYTATLAGPHTLDFSAGNAESFAEISVDPLYVVDSLTIELSSESIDQLGNFTVTVKAFDQYLNPIPIPSSANVDATGRAEVLNQGQGVWNIVTLDDGPQTVTITAGKVSEERTIEVTGNVGGFFKAGGALYYVGAVLIAIVSLVIIGLLVATLRGGDSDYDDEDEDYDDDNTPSGPAPGPSGPAPGTASGPSGPAPETKTVPAIAQVSEDTSWQVEHRVDDDGTEWAQDENEVWYYRQEGETEWDEWTD
ncbi:MAG: hypothetical protein OSA21_01380, partial [Candidatus Poseidoniaceae archaeon]|nr:hypothetical protein [Candidatus Poseidoniaceae archaeon]